jgi:phosphatidylglycerol:prolipoprotein diacylglycerol transferase
MGGIHLGPILLHWNGILILLGFAMGAILATRETRRRGYDSEIILDLIVPLLICGTMGARLWHIFTPPLSSIQLGLTTWHYLTHPLDLSAIWVGGIGFPGALLGGVIGLYYICIKYELNFSEWLDILTPALALGQAIGRLGNFISQELYGLPTNVPWKIFINPEHRLAGFESIKFYHPLFAYESILSLINMFFLMWVSRHFANRLKSGDLFLVYLITSSGIRFCLEFMRLDVSLVNGMNINQLTMAVVLLASGTFLCLRIYSVKEL